MIVQICDLSEGFATIDALIWPIVCVNPLVIAQICRLREACAKRKKRDELESGGGGGELTFVAIGADKLALRRVISYVRHERGFAREGLVAQRAGALLVEYQIHLRDRNREREND